MFKFLMAILLLLCMGMICNGETEKSSIYHLIMWHQEWCGPCKIAEKELKPLAIIKSVNFEEVDPDDLKTRDERLFYATEKITNYPTFVLYIELNIGKRTYLKEIGRQSGYYGKDSMLVRIKNWKDQFK